MTDPLPAANAPSALALLDRNHLDAMTGGDKDLAVEVIEIFQHQAEIWSRMLDPKLPTGQWADAAHTLKGASLGVGALKLANVCEIAERLGRADDAPSITAAAVAIGDVKSVLGETLEAVAKAIYELTSAGARKAS
jgi:HPt (histidine-containing phosphotransfer) domain-containing protein